MPKEYLKVIDPRQQHMSKLAKGRLFILTTRGGERPPTRTELFVARSHIVKMREALKDGVNPYVYMADLPEGSRMRYILADLNRTGDSLWPLALTTNIRIMHAKHTLTAMSSYLNTILKAYH